MDKKSKTNPKLASWGHGENKLKCRKEESKVTTYKWSKEELEKNLRRLGIK